MDLTQWINQQRATYSDDQIKTIMKSQGYSDSIINQYFPNTLGKILKGLVFFNILSAIILSIAAYFIINRTIHNYVSSFQVISLIVLSFVFVLCCFFGFWKFGRKGESIVSLFVMFTAPLSLIVLVLSFIGLGLIQSYFLIVCSTLFFGFLFAYTIDLAVPAKQLINANIMMSSIVAAALAPNHMVHDILVAMLQRTKSATGENIVVYLFIEPLSPTILFIVAMICFIAPGILAYLQKPGADRKQLAKYLIPIMVYIVLAMVLTLVTNQIVAI